jgi:hypothetical protein
MISSISFAKYVELSNSPVFKNEEEGLSAKFKVFRKPIEDAYNKA